MRIDFHELNNDNTSRLIYVVLQARYKGKWIFVRHVERTTWEIPAGHIEEGETPDEAASRELQEETGAIDFSIEPLFDYSVTVGEKTSYGRLYYCHVSVIGELGDYEIDEVKFDHELPSNLTYEDIQPYLFDKVKKEKGME